MEFSYRVGIIGGGQTHLIAEFGSWSLEEDSRVPNMVNYNIDKFKITSKFKELTWNRFKGFSYLELI